MNKICTSIEQSKKLIELGVDVNTADMYWWFSGKRYYIKAIDDGDFNEKGDIRAWSLAALLNVIRETVGYELLCDNTSIIIKCELGDNPWSIEINENNEVDACYEMIIKLHEQKIL